MDLAALILSLSVVETNTHGSRIVGIDAAALQLLALWPVLAAMGLAIFVLVLLISALGNYRRGAS